MFARHPVTSPAHSFLTWVGAGGWGELTLAEQCVAPAEVPPGRRVADGHRAASAAGLPGPARAELLGICRRHSMRMVGPASFGVANPGIGLDATFAARHPRPGTAGLALQSTGGTGFVLVEHPRLGVGISSLVSLGDKDDVSGTGMLQWWESDEGTKLALLCLDRSGIRPSSPCAVPELAQWL